MRIRRIDIEDWRIFQNVSIDIPDGTGLVCIVGANGTGKSHLLELVASCAHQLGLSQGIEIPRGDPFRDWHKFSLTFYLAPGISAAADASLADDPSFADWDRTLSLHSVREEGGTRSKSIEAGGISDGNVSAAFAQAVISRLQESKDIHFLFLDADRAYPKKKMDNNEMARAYETDWKTPAQTKGQSFKRTNTLYSEWLKYCLASENQASTNLVRRTRKARMTGGTDPTFEDHFEPYKKAVEAVLPHVVFVGVDSHKRTLLFDTSGLELTFDQLSGGEREIAFLVGQIDRFGLRQGLFLLDEPELHLNADLIRTWVEYLLGTVKEGQIWLATHSLEAVEAAGEEATFVLERNDGERKVDGSERLDRRPLLATLARAVGTPAFSISKLRFVFVEGEERLGERERFRSLLGSDEDTRFIECGSCSEVIRRVAAVKSIAREAGDAIRVGGIVDRDFRTDSEAADVADGSDVFVLGVHEIENLYLHPEIVDALLRQNGIGGVAAEDVIREEADGRAGSWIYHRFRRMIEGGPVAAMIDARRAVVKALTWEEIEAEQDALADKVFSTLAVGSEEKAELTKRFSLAVRSYERQRAEGDWWARCEGKEVLRRVTRRVEFANRGTLKRAAHRVWEAEETTRPQPLEDLRSFVDRI